MLDQTKKPKRPRDPFQRARYVAQLATGQIEEPAKNKVLSPERRSEIVKRTANTRWNKK